jgi:cobalt-zinc-cadmium efflux system protein
MGHDHHHIESRKLSRKLVAATAATALFVVAQLLIGYTANSLALIGDAIHNFTDTLALLLALAAVRLQQRPPTHEKSYGYHRAGVLAAFINAGTLVALTMFIFVEAVRRFREPQSVNDTAMIVTALAGIVLNVTITFAFRRERRQDVNIRSAVVHMLGDAISSAGIVIAALLIRFTGYPQWDPAISVLIGVLILWSSWGILKETVNLLLEGTPSGIDPMAVRRSLGEIDGVLGVHHLHIWALGPSVPALSCHLMVGDVPVKSTARLIDHVNDVLSRQYGIAHTTIQFEFANCAVDDPFCVPFTAEVGMSPDK